MAYFSSFWYKHYRDIGNCCMTAPLEVPPTLLKKMPNTPTSRTVLTYIDTGWMSEKKLKWIGWDVDGWITWIDPNGMMYRVRDLKRNGDGIEFEKNYEELKTQVNPEKPVYTSVLAYYTHEMNVQKTCGYCPDRSSVPSDDDDTDSSESTGGVTQQNVTAPPWQTFAGGGAPDYGGINTGNNPNVPSANYGGYGDIYTEYTPPTADPGETVKTEGVTDTSKTAGGSNPPATAGGKTSISIDVTKSPAAPPPKHGSDISKDIKIQEVAKIDKLRVKPNIPPQNKDIKFPTPSKPIKDADEWFKQPEQDPAKKPPIPPAPPKPTPKPAPKLVIATIDTVNTSPTASGGSGKFTEKDAEKALKLIYETKGRERAEIIEQMYRLEGTHFTSDQYIATGTPGMEVHGKAPYYGWEFNEGDKEKEYLPTGVWSGFEGVGLSKEGGNAQDTKRPKQYIVFSTVEAGMFAVSNYIDRHGGNYARWHSKDPIVQNKYRNTLKNVKPRIVNKFK